MRTDQTAVALLKSEQIRSLFRSVSNSRICCPIYLKPVSTSISPTAIVCRNRIRQVGGHDRFDQHARRQAAPFSAFVWLRFHNPQADSRTYFRSVDDILLSLHPLHIRPDDRHPDRLPAPDPHPPPLPSFSPSVNASSASGFG